MEEVNGADGAIVLVDMGSAVMTAELVLEKMHDDHLLLVDAPLVEGAVLAAVAAAQGKNVQEVAKAAESARQMCKCE